MENKIKNITFHNNKFNELISMVMNDNSGKLSLLPINDRALIYTMYWCMSDHCNRQKYEFDTLLDLSKKVSNYLNR